MIINASGRTDIIAYYSSWFFRRLQEGYVDVRNPYYPQYITRYVLDREVVDCIVFCTKNPRPVFAYLKQLKTYDFFFYITITPYDRSIELYVPFYRQVIQDFQKLSSIIGAHRMALRYDPIFLNDTYTIDRHIDFFEEILSQLKGYTHHCIISFIDLYAKTKRNFPHIQEVSWEDQRKLAKAFYHIAQKYDVKLQTCAEEQDFRHYGFLNKSCLNLELLEEATGHVMMPMRSSHLRVNCHCYPSRDIGEYHSCPHGCLYCYANDNLQKALRNYHRHDPLSSLLIGHLHQDDIIKHAKQKSYKERQLTLDL